MHYFTERVARDQKAWTDTKVVQWILEGCASWLNRQAGGSANTHDRRECTTKGTAASQDSRVQMRDATAAIGRLIVVVTHITEWQEEMLRVGLRVDCDSGQKMDNMATSPK